MSDTDDKTVPTAWSDTWSAALRELDQVRALKVGVEAIARIGAQRFADEVLLPSMESLGADWEAGRASLAEVYMAGRISERVVSGHVVSQGARSTPIAIALLDDFHALGKTLVLTSLRLGGIHVLDYGTMAPVPLARRAMDDGVELLFVSTLMLRSALRVELLVNELREHESPARVIVGGAPFRMDPELWRTVGADGTGSNASDAVRIARDWLQERR